MQILTIPKPMQKKLDELGLTIICTSDKHQNYIWVCYAKQMKYNNEFYTELCSTTINGLPYITVKEFDLDLRDLSEICRPWLTTVCWACENFDSPIVDNTEFSKDIAYRYRKFKEAATVDDAVEQYKKEMFEKEEE